LAPNPLPLRERVDRALRGRGEGAIRKVSRLSWRLASQRCSIASGRGRSPEPPHPPHGPAKLAEPQASLNARHPLPQGERVSEYAPRSSLDLPDRGAVLLVLKLNAYRFELVADTVGLLEVSRLAGGVATVNQRIDLTLVHASALAL